MNQRKATNPDSTAPCELSPQQQRAIDLIVGGKSLTEAARELQLTRQTLSEWANQHHGFKAALNGRRQEVWSSAGDALRSMLPRAVAALDAALDGPDGVRAALGVLRLAIGSAGLAPIGPTDPREVEAVDQEAAAELARRHGFALAGI